MTSQKLNLRKYRSGWANQKDQVEKRPFAKNQHAVIVPISGEIQAMLCSDDSVQILLK